MAQMTIEQFATELKMPPGALMFISLIGPTAIVAGIRAYLNTNKKVTILASGADVKRASAPSRRPLHKSGRVLRSGPVRSPPSPGSRPRQRSRWPGPQA